MKATKFTFGTSFDTPAQPKKAPVASFSEQQLLDAEAAAFAKGMESGRQKAMADIAEQTAIACATLAKGVAQLLATEAARHQQVEREAADMALAIARKLAPALMAAEPLGEIRRVVGDCLALAHREARLLVRVAEDLTDSVKQACEETAQAQGFVGKLVILGDPNLHGSNCRVEWADGGYERDVARIDQEISQIITRYIDSKQSAADPSQP